MFLLTGFYLVQNDSSANEGLKKIYQKSTSKKKQRNATFLTMCDEPISGEYKSNLQKKRVVIMPNFQLLPSNLDNQALVQSPSYGLRKV